MRNSMGLNNYLSINGLIPMGTNTINYIFKTSENNTVTQICYTTIIYCYFCTIPVYLDYVNIGFIITSNGSSGIISFPVPTTNYTPNTPTWDQYDRWFFGIG
jgi:hypothetical protein